MMKGWPISHQMYLMLGLIRPLLASAALSVLLLSCSPDSLLPDQSTSVVPTMPSGTAIEEGTAPPSPAPAATPLDIETGVEAVASALQASDSQALASLLVDPVWLAEGPNGDQGQSITHAGAVKWLNARWGKQRTVASDDYVDHFVLLEISTSGWANVSPLHNGIIVFHLHRYDAQGQPDALHGTWRIDTILYQ